MGGGASRYDRGVFLGGSERDADKLGVVSGVVRRNGSCTLLLLGVVIWRGGKNSTQNIAGF